MLLRGKLTNRDQIAGEGAASALIAACGVELSIPPNVGQQCGIALNRQCAYCHCHLYRECPLLRSGYDFLDGPSGVHQELPVFFHDLD